MNKIGNYEILGIVGGGGMGTVFKARDPRFDSFVAIKALHPHFQLNPEIAARFKAEAVIQRKLNHPNIVTVYDFVADDSGLAMVMEYVDGVTLARLLEDCRGLLEPARVLRLMDQVLAAIAYAHAQGLVHRDIKPGNIMVQRFGTDEVVKIVDFGIAKIFGAHKVQTATGAKMGTLAYMSPEHIRSPRSVDARSDIYSLGVVIYEMVAGRVPFEADSEYDLMQQIVTKPPAPLLRGPKVDRFDQILNRALAKAPIDRFQNCEELRAALRVISTGTPVDATVSAEGEQPAPAFSLLPEASSGIAAAVGRALAKDPRERFPRAEEFRRAMAVPISVPPPTSPSLSPNFVRFPIRHDGVPASVLKWTLVFALALGAAGAWYYWNRQQSVAQEPRATSAQGHVAVYATGATSLQIVVDGVLQVDQFVNSSYSFVDRFEDSAVVTWANNTHAASVWQNGNILCAVEALDTKKFRVTVPCDPVQTGGASGSVR